MQSIMNNPNTRYLFSYWTNQSEHNIFKIFNIPLFTATHLVSLTY